MTTVYCDMDGVLADFDSHHETVFGTRACKVADNVDWKAVRGSPGFYSDIPPMRDMRQLWDYLWALTPKPIILTGVPRSVPEAPDNKRGWVVKHLGPDVEVRCCLSREKSLHAQPGAVMVDDWAKYKDLWLAKGGRWITHTSAAETIRQLGAMGIRP